MDYAQDIEIREDELDVEWIGQASLVMKYCVIAADAHRDLDLAKEQVDIIRAQIDRDVRSDPAQFGLDKVTEGSITSTILTSPDYQEAVKSYLQKKYEHEVAQGAVRAFDHRKSALENLVRLFGQSYFAGPAVPHNLSEVRSQRDAAAQKKIGIQRRR